jgi:hypothetical protein
MSRRAGLLREHLDHRATVTEVHQLLEEARFSVSRVVENTSCMRFANATTLVNHHFIKLGFLDAWKKVVPGRETGVFTRIRHALDEIATPDNGLRLTIAMAYVERVAV